MIWLFFLCQITVSGDYDSDGQLTVSVLHSLDPSPHGVFTPRGAISVRSLRSGGSATYQPTGALSSAELAQLKVRSEVCRIQIRIAYVCRIKVCMQMFICKYVCWLKYCQKYISKCSYSKVHLQKHVWA